MLGAPFWFVVLSTLRTVRSTKSPADTSADKKHDATAAPPPLPGSTAAAANPPVAAAQAAPVEPNEWRDGFDNPGQVVR